MELCLVSTIADFVAIQLPYCRACAERKLNCEIIKSWPLDKSECDENEIAKL